ncbi:disease resistance protein PIK6-NP-like [Oryza glaberrima]|uniref:disease resistance protein PIK6-NP-like n=1 Tax=Oryza glaberrima TaxID=4538 RepID=UPI00224C38AE|nr:disease resistance protein PIK6-NP-like [Oryza glaberrima]
MQVVTGAMGTLLPKLANLLTEEYKLHKNLRGEVLFLKAELESMEAALLKISEAPIDQPPDPQVKLWARDVRDLSYDIEDSVDKFMVRVDTDVREKSRSCFRGFIDRGVRLLTRAKVRHNIGTDIKEIKSQIKEVSERRDRYKVDSVATKPIGPTIDRFRLSAMYKKVTELVAIDETSDELVKRIMGEDDESKQKLKIVSIVGVGGLGKTTLANVVYERIITMFDCSAFVSISLNPDMERIFKNMLYQLDMGKYFDIHQKTWDEAQLINELREFLRNKRYFIVVDDIWDKSTWKMIKCSLPENEHGSGIITTTRILDVGKQVGGVYQLKPLSMLDSVKLFYLRIFGYEDKCPTELAQLSENILKKCGGLPLAIITIASMLACKIGKENLHKYWSKVYQSLGSGLEDSLDIKNMRKILSISYHDLPPHLKTCLLYLSLYPEDSEINTHDLIWKWVGEGFVHRQCGRSFYEVGEEYFDELINKSLIQPAYISTGNKKEMSCRVHDMVLDLITSLSNEECFLTTLCGQQHITLNCKVRRLSVQITNENGAKQMSTLSLSHTRSLFLFSGFNLVNIPALSSFPVLRVLDLSSCLLVDNHHLKDICKYLFHLRYLDLSRTSITEIPRQIENLQLLQVLHLRGTGIRKFPSTFVQLGQLVCLTIDSTIQLPNGFGNLKHLEELEANIEIISEPNIHDLGMLTELTRLHIGFREWHKSYEEPLHQCLSNLIGLEYLRIDGCYGSLDSACDSLSQGPHQQVCSIDMWERTIHAVPNWMAGLSTLSKLEIVVERLVERDLQMLGRLPSLGHLSLGVERPTMGRDERLIIANGYLFQCLTFLYFWSHTIDVEFAQGAMPKLQNLSLFFDVEKAMDQFGHVYIGLENLAAVGHVEIIFSLSTHTRGEVVEAAIRRQICMNRNSPTLNFR